MISTMVSGRLRQLDRWLHINLSDESKWGWTIPVVGFVVTAAILIVAGVMSGVWAAEYIPTALVVGLVISGLFVACMLPEAIPPEHDQGNRAPDPEPSATPPRFDPTVWVALLADSDVETVRAEERREEALRERVAASR